MAVNRVASLVLPTRRVPDRQRHIQRHSLLLKPLVLGVLLATVFKDYFVLAHAVTFQAASG